MTSPRPILSLDDAIRWRRDVRRFRRDPVPTALLAEVLALAEHAPSVGNSQPWRITAVDSQSARDRVCAVFKNANAEAADSYPPGRREHYRSLKLAGFDAAPVHLAVTCAEATTQGDGLGAASMPEMRRYSCVSMITVLWLAARSRGLGLGWVSILDPAETLAALGLPPHDEEPLVGYLLLGWPEEEHLDPELERLGWQARTDAGTRMRTA